ncbi:hypothetical protein D3C80_1557090 [compost metagenome]
MIMEREIQSNLFSKKLPFSGINRVLRSLTDQYFVSPKNEAKPKGSDNTGNKSGVAPEKSELAIKGELPSIEPTRYKI